MGSTNTARMWTPSGKRASSTLLEITTHVEVRPLIDRLLILTYRSGSMTIMPVSWADLAEDDPEMQIMGPPQSLPLDCDPEWCLPKRPMRRAPPVPITPFLTQQNQFTALQALLAPDEDASAMRQLAPEVAAAVRTAWVPAPLASEPVTSRPPSLALPSTSLSEEEQPPPPPPRMRSTSVASSP